MRRADSFEKTLMLGKIEGRRRRGWQRMRWLDGITDLMDWVWASFWSWWWTGKPGMLQSVHGVTKSQTRLSDWTYFVFHMGFLGDTSGKELTYQCRRWKRCGFDPGLGRSPGRGHGNPLQYSCLGNPRDRGTWWAPVHEAAKNQKRRKWLSTAEAQRTEVFLAFSCNLLHFSVICYNLSLPALFWKKSLLQEYLQP